VVRAPEIAFRAAITVLRDSVESRRMSWGEPLEPDGVTLHARLADHMENLLCQARAKAKP
jgi:hypothetical protein